MMRKISTSVLLVGLLFYGSFSCAGASPSAWRMQSAKGDIILLGSVHIGEASFYPLPVEIEKAFDQSFALAVELDVAKLDPDRTSEMVHALGFYSAEEMAGGKNVFSVLPGKSALALREFCASPNSICPSVEHMKPMRPWLLSLHFANEMLSGAGFDTALGVDRYFLARAQGKPIIELESFASQIQLFASMSDVEQTAFLSQTLFEYEHAHTFVAALMEAWRRGDDSALTELIITPMLADHTAAGLYEVLLLQRNRQMAAKVEALSRPGQTLFVVVGAGHLLGGDGLVALLMARGYKAGKL